MAPALGTDADPLLAALAPLSSRFPRIERLAVAFSGGLDSTVLLDAAARTGLPLRALHVDHAVHPDAGHWSAHCAGVCAARDIPLDVRRLDWSSPPSMLGDLEARLREARYGFFERALRRGELLLIAHHADDQLETLLYRLARGSGAAGLAGMPVQRRLGRSWLWRPLLDLPRSALTAYARRRALRWLEDPGNRDPRFDRNHLRAEVVPGLRARWPAAAQTAARAARQLAESEALLQRLLRPRLQARMRLADGQRCPDWSLSLAGLETLPGDERRALLRLWLRENGLLAISQRVLQSVEADLVAARPDADPVIVVEDATLRRHRARLYLVPEPSPLPEAFDWCPETGPCEVDGVLLSRDSAFGRRLALDPGQCLRVGFRHGGERIALRGGTRALKKVLHEAGVPSWQRARVPLLFSGERLLAAWGIAIDRGFEK